MDPGALASCLRLLFHNSLLNVVEETKKSGHDTQRYLIRTGNTL
jgi:hypothetical protein